MRKPFKTETEKEYIDANVASTISEGMADDAEQAEAILVSIYSQHNKSVFSYGGETFKTKKEYIDYLITNKSDIINLKKSIIKFTDANILSVDKLNSIIKADAPSVDDLSSGIIKRTIIGNTYNWMDSHGDVHMKGIFTKSINENQKNILHLHDHEYKISSKVGTPSKVYEKEISWSDLGVSKQGSTTALMMDSEIKKSYNAMIFDEYLNKQINQHSVGMIYVKMQMCVNDAQYKEEFGNWNTYFPMVANATKALNEGVFWAVTEAKLKEISCVISGSNELTPTMEPKSTPTNEPKLRSTIDYKYLKNNFNLK